MFRSILAMAVFALLGQPLWAHGPCCCMSQMGGSGASSSVSPGLLQLAASQQQLANQQVAAMLQDAQVAAFVQRVAQEDEEAVRKRSRSRNPLERYAAALAIGQSDLPLKKELAALRADPNPVVRQAAGQSTQSIAKRSRQATQNPSLQTSK